MWPRPTPPTCRPRSGARAMTWCSVAASGSSPVRRTRTASCSSCCAATQMPTVKTATTATAWCWCPWARRVCRSCATSPCCTTMRRRGIARFCCAACACLPTTYSATGAQGLRWRRRAWGRAACTTACAPSVSASWRCAWPPNARWSARRSASRWPSRPMCRNGWPSRASRSTRRACWCCTLRGCWTRAMRQMRAPCVPRSLPSRWWPRACSSAWWTGPCRFLARWACRPTRRWPPSGLGAARCG